MNIASTAIYGLTLVGIGLMIYGIYQGIFGKTPNKLLNFGTVFLVGFLVALTAIMLVRILGNAFYVPEFIKMFSNSGGHMAIPIKHGLSRNDAFAIYGFCMLIAVMMAIYGGNIYVSGMFIKEPLRHYGFLAISITGLVIMVIATAAVFL